MVEGESGKGWGGQLLLSLSWSPPNEAAVRNKGQILAALQQGEPGPKLSTLWSDFYRNIY